MGIYVPGIELSVFGNHIVLKTVQYAQEVDLDMEAIRGTPR